MNIVCLDMEGVLMPEIWVAFSKVTGLPELAKTTRDEPDYSKLMRHRLDVLRGNGLGIKEIQETIATIDPIPGAREFVDELRKETQVMILSDTFMQFGMALMPKLNYPTLLCNDLVIGDDGMIEDFKMRCDHSKLTTVRGLQSIGFDTIAVGDSFNDIEMIQASKAGFLFKSPESIRAQFPEFPAYEEYDELLAAIGNVL